MNRILLVPFIIACSFQFILAQTARNKGNLITVNAAYSLQLPQGDMQDRFGQNLAAGLGVDYITAKSNIILGVHGDFLFGANVKEDVIASLRNDEGNIIANDKGITDIVLRQRGLHLNAHVGKIFALSKRNKRSGIRFTVGAGLLQHKVRIQDEPQRFVPQLSQEYKKGYDRLSNGLALSQFLGYQWISLDGRMNLHLGVEVIEAFTKSRRSFNFDTMMPDDTQRFDMLLGFKLNYSLPFYLSKSADDIIY